MTDMSSYSAARTKELAAIAQLTSYLDFDETVRKQGARIWEIIAPRIDGIIDEFYSELDSSKFGVQLDQQTIGRLKVSQREHWRVLFSSQFDDTYLHSVTRVGIRHHSLGLDPKWYVAGYAVYKIEFTREIMRTPLSLTDKAGLIEALDRYVAVDMGLALSTYTAAILD